MLTEDIFIYQLFILGLIGSLKGIAVLYVFVI